MDPLGIVVDEVALEGLDGITIPSLWIRLEDRKPAFRLKLDDCTKELIWKSIISNTDLKVYQVPKERDDVVLFDRFKDIDPETGIETTQRFSDTRKDVYPVHIILENKNGIQGSCAFFKERTDITKLVCSKSLTPLLNLQEALERYGRKLVVVASQPLRFRTLIGMESDPDLKLNDDSYCVLERVGRARWQGELQRDLHGCSFKIDARKLHYMRKSLVKHGLISMQSHVTRVNSGQQQHSILLLLKRFHVNRRAKYDILMEYVSNLLQQSPGQFATLITFKEQLNVDERTSKRVFQYMRAAKLVEYCQYPLEDLDPSAGPCTNKKGNKVLVRCLRLLKPYTKKGVTDDDDDEDEDEEDYTGARERPLPPEGRIMESDVLSQSYNIVLSSGAKGIPQRGVASRMNAGKLEARMLCRRLERDGAIKGFMEDEGRQRTTKYISHKCVGVSNQLQLFAKEQERKKLLYSSAPQMSDAAPPTPKTPTTSKSKKQSAKSPAAKKVQKAGGGRNKDAKEAGQTSGDGEVNSADGGSDGEGGEAGEKSSVKTNQTQPEIPTVQLTPAESETPACSKSMTSVAPDSVSTSRAEARVEDEESNSNPGSASPQSEALNADDYSEDNNVVEVKDVWKLQGPTRKKSKYAMGKSHETYRLLRRKNLIVESVRSLKIIEGLFPLQKIINDEEKQDGISSKCCRKTILRLVDNLSREGLLKVYKTTVIQDGITKKVEMVVHPSVQPNDDIVTRVIDQVRFRISSSYTAVRLQHAEEKAKEQGIGSDDVTGDSPKSQKREKKRSKADEFKPTTVRGLGKTFGFQPKMHRMRLVHNFLWYLIYGHPGNQNSSDSKSSSETPAEKKSSDPDAKQMKDSTNGQTQPSEKAASGSVDPPTADSACVISSGDEEEELKETSTPGPSQSDFKAYTEEESWKKFIPPVRVHKEFGSGWAMVGDLLLCLPLSIFIQVIQINYKVEGLEEYLNDPVKQHHLISALPARMRRQLLYKRRYIFSFHENLQKMVYMGLLQFGPVEKFKEKDQVFVYLRRNATIVDTTNAEPHYWLVTESSDKPFEQRQYSFNTVEDVENYWFDLMCVCLNTPLGVIRNKRNATEEEHNPSFVHERNVFVGLAYLLKGNRQVCDDGSIPGDGKGAGGLDSEFFAHLKRNWLWTNHLLSVRTTATGLEAKENKVRLKSLLSKNALRIALKAGGSTTPRYVTAKRPLVETVEMDVEPASRNQQVVGGKKQKRKRTKKEVVKAPRKKKKEPKKRTPAHDEADHRALKMMTRQRVYWSVQEDSLMMLCSVASHLLNSKLKRPFVPYCVVRDLLHAEFEISMDKTSVAVGRRTRYILKNPQTLLNYRICLAEVYQDKPLMRLLEGKKPADPNSPQDCAKSFAEYARLLRQKFSAVILSARDMIMPDSKLQLFSRFKVSAIENGKRVSWKDDLNCTDDIHAIVLQNLIQSTLAMTNNQMKSSRSFQTFHMYSKYNQELLCQAFIQCRKRGLVNRRRINQPFGPKKNRALPILPMSYQLSQSYYRCFSWRFPHSLCTDSFRFLRSLINNGTADNKPVTAFYHETENRSENGEEVMERRTGSERKKKQSKRKEDRATASKPEVPPGKEGENDQSKKEEEEKVTEVNEEINPEKEGENHQSKKEEEEKVTEVNEEINPENDGENDQSKMEEEEKVTEVNEEINPEKEGENDQSKMEEEKVTEVNEEIIPEKEGENDQSKMEEEKVTEVNEEKTEATSKTDEQKNPEDCLTAGSGEAPSSSEQTHDHLPKEEPTEVAAASNAAPRASEEPPAVSDMMQFSMDSPGGASGVSLSLMSLGLLNVYMSIPKQMVVVDSNLVDNDVVKSMAALDEEDEDDEDGDECEGRKKMEVKAHQASHTNYLMMRGYCFPGIVKIRNLNTLDNIVVESCIMRLQLRDTPAHHMFSMEGSPPLDLTKCGPSLLPYVLSSSTRTYSSSSSSPHSLKECDGRLVQQRGYTPQDVEACARLRRSLDAAGENGLDVPDLYKTHVHLQEPRCGRSRSLQQYLEELQEEGQVIKVGGLGPRWVLMQHADPWLLTVRQPSKQWSQSRSDRLPFLENDHNIPFMRKRARREVRKQTEEPPAKKTAVDKREGEGSSSDVTGEKLNEEEQLDEQKDGADDGSGDNLEEEGGKLLQPEEDREHEAGREEVETEERQEENNRVRADSLDDGREEGAACSPPTTPADVDNDGNVSFISRPWRMVDGNLNRQVCKGMLEAINYHVMYRPGLTQQSLVEHYKDVLQPMAVLDLVQALIDIGCVTKKTLIKAPKPSLFTRSAHPTSSHTKVTMEEPDSVFYEPTISCCLRLGQMLPNERHWNCCLP
ncbi:general transcription factor 3C polypeptide 1 isoform X2 [Cottoperca gobio]|uniref:General transcription factor 3C polypeptide 1 isoform X2 n=1 Tax=Cottoperca gobio TaxID=56716 RepID=A0A6J2RPG0_COTGO|nr:general transcription factor 3C polypeptide 1 isoform X2 [Cottoperca gobio]